MMSSKHYIGLTDQEVLKSRELNGSNELVAPESDPAWKEFLLKFTGPFGHLFKKKVGPNAGEEYEDGDPLIFVLEIAAVLSFLVSLTFTFLSLIFVSFLVYTCNRHAHPLTSSFSCSVLR